MLGIRGILLYLEDVVGVWEFEGRGMIGFWLGFSGG